MTTDETASLSIDSIGLTKGQEAEINELRDYAEEAFKKALLNPDKQIAIDALIKFGRLILCEHLDLIRDQARLLKIVDTLIADGENDEEHDSRSVN